ncbi:MAG: hypothetical protein WKH64_10750 [Chloroflexia bacterium]
MSTERSVVGWLAILLAALVGGIVFAAVGFFVGGVVHESVFPQDGGLEGIELLFYAPLAGAAVGIVHGSWLAHRLTHRRR